MVLVIFKMRIGIGIEITIKIEIEVENPSFSTSIVGLQGCGCNNHQIPYSYQSFDLSIYLVSTLPTATGIVSKNKE